MQTSVLLVDDDRQQASELHQVLQTERPQWNVHVHPSGSDPIQFMAEHPIDVIVEGGKSPSVLYSAEQVKTHYPNCVRLASDDSTHQGASLVDRIEKSCGLQSRLHDRALQAITVGIVDSQSLTKEAAARLSSTPIGGFSLDAYFQHAQSVGRLAQTIAWVLGDPTDDDFEAIAEQALVAGTLHDIGKLILAIHRREEFSESLVLANDTGKPLWRAEMAVLGTTHAAIGAHLLCDWGYPATLIDAVALHHQPSLCSTDDCPTLAAVHVANAVQHAITRPSERSVEFNINALGSENELPIWDEEFLEGLGLLDRARQWAVRMRSAQLRESFSN